MIALQPLNIRWVTANDEHASDLCAHGEVEFCINGDVLIEPPEAEDLTVSATALFLLRTLTESHTRENPLCDQLFPCCGHAMWDIEGESDVLIQGCNCGPDFEIVRQSNGSGVIVRAHDGREWAVGSQEWQVAVFGFADAVSRFYSRSRRRRPSQEERPGFVKFVAEWERRRGERLCRPSSLWDRLLERARRGVPGRMK